MKRKLNNALNNIDQHFIDEAAEADRLDSRAPKILKFTLIPAGAAAAVALCILAANSFRPGGVDLVQNTADSSLSADSLAIKQQENTGTVVYYCENLTLEFDPGDHTVKFTSSANAMLSGSYSVNGNDIRMKLDNDHSYRGVLSDDGSSFEITNPDMELYSCIYAIDEASAAKLDQQMSSGIEPSATFEKLSSAGLKNTAHKITTASGFDKYITDMLTDRMRYTGDQYNKQKAYELIVNSALPLDDEHTVTRATLDRDPKGGSHMGTDLFDENSTKTGANVYAFQSGTVIAVYAGGGDDSIGNYIVIDHGSGLATVYAALGDVAVSEGQTVSKGEVIAHTGISGWSTEEHLHFEIRRDGIASHSTDKSTTTFLTQKIVDDCNNEILRILDSSGVNDHYDSEAADALISSGELPLRDDDIYTYHTAGYDPYYDMTFYDSEVTIPGVGSRDYNVYAFQSGKVIAAADDGFNDGLGSYIVIDHGSGVATVYAHLSEINVNVGQKVDRADIIGKMGNTGWTETTVLHFELRRNGNALDVLSLNIGTNTDADNRIRSEAVTYAGEQELFITDLLAQMHVNDNYDKSQSEELRQNAVLPLQTATLQDANSRVDRQTSLASLIVDLKALTLPSTIPHCTI